jgi:Tfp pilus assembly pilus retraction ATPase PilT
MAEVVVGVPAQGTTGPLMDMRELFQLAFERRASDIHLTEHSPPVLRIDGDLVPTTLPQEEKK